jgi:hypothetical protein
MLQADCAKWKDQRKHDDNPRLTRKFRKWSNDNFNHISSLTISVLHPISRIRLETQVAAIRLKELPNGFRVLSAEAALIKSLTDSQNQCRETILSNQTNHSEDVCCLAMYEMEAIDSANNSYRLECYGFGTYSNLSAAKKMATTENGRRAELIQILNNEL